MGVMWNALAQKIENSRPEGVGFLTLLLTAMILTAVTAIAIVGFYYLAHY